MIDEQRSGSAFDPSVTDVSVSEEPTSKSTHSGGSSSDDSRIEVAMSQMDQQENVDEENEERIGREHEQSHEQSPSASASEGSYSDSGHEPNSRDEEIPLSVDNKGTLGNEGIPAEAVEEVYSQFADQTRAVDQTQADLVDEQFEESSELKENDELAKVTAERDEYLDALRRLQAEFENYRKRVIKQQTDSLERAAEDLVVKLLPILDVLDLADAHLPREDDVGGSTSSTDAVSALRQVRRMLFDLLSKEGLERVDTAGSSFDPVVHEAVAHEVKEDKSEDSEKQDLSVAEVMRAGYLWKGRLIRPAMVRVQG